MFEICTGNEVLIEVSGCEAAWAVWSSVLPLAQAKGQPLALWAKENGRHVMVAHS